MTPHHDRLPWVARAVAGLAVVFVALPFVGLLGRLPWRRLGDLVADPDVRSALWLSVRTSSAATLVATALGIPLAWVLARSTARGLRLVRSLVTLSMVLPPVVAGVALLAAFGRRGVFGRYLDDWFGVRLPFTTAGVVVAQVFVALPFVVLTVEAALRQFDPRIEAAARSLGGGPWHVFRRVTLPSVRPALAAGAVLAWARALGEFGATITFAGSFPGRTQTLPIATYLALETDPDEALLIASVLIVVSLAVLLGLRDRWTGTIRGGVA